MGAYYSFKLIIIETYAPQFIGHNIFFLGSVDSKDSQEFPGMFWFQGLLKNFEFKQIILPVTLFLGCKSVGIAPSSLVIKCSAFAFVWVVKVAGVFKFSNSYTIRE